MPSGFCWRIQEEKCHYEDLDVSGLIILKGILEKFSGINWIDLTYDREH
jgi:hypothetical protein